MNHADFRRRVDDLKRSISLRSLIESDGHKIVRAGGLDKCCCPFHKEKTPSFVIYPDHGHCFGCAWHGDIIHYAMQSRGLDFKSSVDSLGNGHTGGVLATPRPMTRPKEYELPQAHLKHLWEKWLMETDDLRYMGLSFDLGVEVEALINLAWNWAPEHNAWAIPMFNGHRNIVGFRFRAEDGSKWALKGSKQGLFIPAMEPQKDLYVTEGPTDCAAMLSMGLFAIGKAAAMQGPEEIVKFISKNRIRRVIVIADNDRAGLNGAKKLIDVCPVPCCELVLPAKDAREFYRNGGTKELIENLLKSAVWRHHNAKLGHK